jgi:hypothetical protein
LNSVAATCTTWWPSRVRLWKPYIQKTDSGNSDFKPH